ncbi:MAG: hypothetical protein CMJ47_07485 [Planctomyces sp.]|nr:hypothetical protein [Planctomyces sp.]
MGKCQQGGAFVAENWKGVGVIGSTARCQGEKEVSTTESILSLSATGYVKNTEQAMVVRRVDGSEVRHPTAVTTTPSA